MIVVVEVPSAVVFVVTYPPSSEGIVSLSIYTVSSTVVGAVTTTGVRPFITTGVETVSSTVVGAISSTGALDNSSTLVGTISSTATLEVIGGRIVTFDGVVAIIAGIKVTFERDSFVVAFVVVIIGGRVVVFTFYIIGGSVVTLVLAGGFAFVVSLVVFYTVVIVVLVTTNSPVWASISSGNVSTIFCAIIAYNQINPKRDSQINLFMYIYLIFFNDIIKY